jgi:hypothetical protein
VGVAHLPGQLDQFFHDLGGLDGPRLVLDNACGGPDRHEPRARKRRYDNYRHLHIPRAEAKIRLRLGVYQ